MGLSLVNLHNYQKDALAFIRRNPKCALFMDMGLGKTLVSLVAIHFLLKSRRAKKILLVAPLRVCCSTWPMEIKKWKDVIPLNITYSLITGGVKHREAALKSETDIYIINKENVKWLVESLASWPYDTLIIDESSCFKSSSSQRFKALRKISGKFENVLLLSGTPISNSLLDIWPQLFLLDSGRRLLRTFYAYRNEYFKSDRWGFKWEPLPYAQETITAKIQDICLTIKSEGNIEIPDVVSNNIYCQLPASLRKEYEELERTYMLALSKGEQIYASSAAVLFNKLIQFCSGCMYRNQEDRESEEYRILHDIKLQALEEIVEINSGKNILVSFLFKFEKEKIKERFKQSVSIDEPNAIERWNRREIPILIAHPQSAGHGLNLQSGGSTIVWFSMPWSLELYSQFNARLHRQGQREKVFIHHLVMQNTIDELVQERLLGKALGLQGFLERLKSKHLTGEF